MVFDRKPGTDLVLGWFGVFKKFGPILTQVFSLGISDSMPTNVTAGLGGTETPAARAKDVEGIVYKE